GNFLVQRGIAFAAMAGITHALATYLVVGEAGDAGKAVVDGEEMEIRVHDQDAFGGILEHGGGQAQLVFGQLVVGDVAARADHARGAVVVGPLDHAAFVLNPAPVAVGMTNTVDRMVTAGAALEVRHHGTLDLRPVVTVHHLLHVDDEIGEAVAAVAEQAIEIGVVGVAGLDVPVPQADAGGIQRQLQSLAGGTEFGVGGFQQAGTFLDDGFEAVVGFLQMLLGLLALEDLAGELLVQGFSVAAGAIQVVDQRQV